MHPGMPLSDLGKLIIKQNAQKRDVIAPASAMTLVASDELPSLDFAVDGAATRAELTPFALRQLGAWADVPAKYLDRLRAPENMPLLETNINHWLKASSEKRMLRMFEADRTIARAWLSDRYRPLDNYDLAERIMPKLMGANMEVKSASLTDTRLYIQAVSKTLIARLKPGQHQRETNDEVHAGVVVSNSETGSGRLTVEPLLYRVVCTNGLISGHSLRRNHVGRGNGPSDFEGATEFFSDETRRLDDRALWAKVSDTVDAAFDEARFAALVAKFEASMHVELPLDPGHVVDVTAKRLDLTTDERDDVLRHLFEGGDRSLFGLVNAITATGQTRSSYDRAIEMERFGSEALAFTPEMFAKN